MLEKIIFSILIICIPRKRLYRLLEQLEMGVFFFCIRRSQSNDIYTKLQNIFLAQAVAEHYHARYLAKLQGKKGDRSYKQIPQSHSLIYDSQGNYYADGVSRRYWSSRIFFKSQKPSELATPDLLAFMQVYEESQESFYRVLAFITGEKLFGKIADSENSHKWEMKEELSNLVGQVRCDRLIEKWKFRKFLAFLILPIDLFEYLIKGKSKAEIN